MRTFCEIGQGFLNLSLEAEEWVGLVKSSAGVYRKSIQDIREETRIRYMVGKDRIDLQNKQDFNLHVSVLDECDLHQVQ